MWQLYLDKVYGIRRAPLVDGKRLPVYYRVDARTPDHIRVDMRTVGPWEAIDDGVCFPTTVEAKCWAVLHARRCGLQDTLTPTMPIRVGA